MEDQLLRAALEEQEKKLRALNAKLTELREIQEQRDKVHALVSQMRYNLGMPQFHEDPANQPQVDAPTPINIELHDSIPFTDLPIWMAAKEVLTRIGQPMTIRDIIIDLNAHGFKLQDRAGLETVRAALNRKADVFDRFGRKYKLKEPK